MPTIKVKWRSEANSQELVLFFYQVGPWDWTKGIRSRNPKHLGTHKPTSVILSSETISKTKCGFLIHLLSTIHRKHQPSLPCQRWRQPCRQKKRFDLISKNGGLENSGFPLSKPLPIWRNCHWDACVLAYSLWAWIFPEMHSQTENGQSQWLILSDMLVVIWMKQAAVHTGISVHKQSSW